MCTVRLHATSCLDFNEEKKKKKHGENKTKPKKQKQKKKTKQKQHTQKTNKKKQTKKRSLRRKPTTLDGRSSQCQIAAFSLQSSEGTREERPALCGQLAE